MKPSDLCPLRLQDAIQGARIVYFDGRLTDTALVVAHEVVSLYEIGLQIYL